MALLPYGKAFLTGGLICLAGQLLIDRTGLTPARILTGTVVLGVLLGAFGLYRPLIDFAGAGAAVPLFGFGNAIAEGVRQAVAENGRFEHVYETTAGCTVSCHCGPHTLGVLFIRK